MSMLSVFQAMTLTNWSFTMYRTMDYLSPAVVIYWLVMVVFGAYFVVSGMVQGVVARTQGGRGPAEPVGGRGSVQR